MRPFLRLAEYKVMLDLPHRLTFIPTYAIINPKSTLIFKLSPHTIPKGAKKC